MAAAAAKKEAAANIAVAAATPARDAVARLTHLATEMQLEGEVWDTEDLSSRPLAALPLPLKVAVVNHNQSARLLRHTRETVATGCKVPTFNIIRGLQSEVAKKRNRLLSLLQVHSSRVDRALERQARSKVRAVEQRRLLLVSARKMAGKEPAA